MNARAAVVVCALGVIEGCGEPSSGPISPTALSSTERFARCQLIPFHISGVASDEDGRPVAGAMVTIRPFIVGQSPPPITTTTDAGGSYRVEFEGMKDAVGGVGSALAELPGRERHWRYLGPNFSQEIVHNFHLYRIRRIRPGELVTVVVRPDDTACGLDDEWVCRTVRVTAPQDGTLKVTLVSHNASNQTGLEVYEGPFSATSRTRRCCAPEAVLRVGAGAEVVANILVWWTTETSHSFTLETSFASE